jgi:hypothetical protein
LKCDREWSIVNGEYLLMRDLFLLFNFYLIMSEDEIIKKHTKEVYNTWRDPNKTFMHKLKDISLEILIIVFAVSISIWLHNWSETSKDRKEARIFLTGLKEDLQADARDLDSNLFFYHAQLEGLNYLGSVGTGAPLINDSLKKHFNTFFNSTEFDPHISRYEAIKGSGKFRIIESAKLLDTIIHLHEQTLVYVNSLNKLYYNYNNSQVMPFLNQHLQLGPAGNITNTEEILKNSQLRFYIAYDKSLITGNILSVITDAIKECKNIVKMIDEELKE